MSGVIPAAEEGATHDVVPGGVGKRDEGGAGAGHGAAPGGLMQAV